MLDITITITDILMILALIVGPFLGIYAQKEIEGHKERRAKQLYIFRVLMATRSTPVNPDHVTALNLIDIDFSTKKEKEKLVIDAWHALQYHLDTGYPNPNTDKDAPEYQPALHLARKKSKEYLENLLNEMSKCLGSDFEKIVIQRASYYSESQAQKDEDEFLIRRGLVGVISGNIPLNVNVKSFTEQSPNETEPKVTK